MTKITKYIDSGILEQYYFDLFNAERAKEIAEVSLLHPEVRHELDEIEQTIELLAKSHEIVPDPKVKQRIFAALGFADKEQLDLNNLPLTSKYSSYTSWLNAVEHLIPAEPFEEFFSHVLREDEHIAQTLVITRQDVAPEIHDDVEESFFILKGRCVCTIGDEVITLNPGDHLDIKLNVTHDVKILSPYLIAILQHQFC